MRPLFAVLLAQLLFGALPARADQTWLVVSDIHLDPYDKNPVPSGYTSDTNWALWQSALSAMRSVDSDPRVVIVTGDFLAHHFPALVTASGGGATAQQGAERAMRSIEQSLAKTFPRSQFLIVLGNNDDPCGDYRTAPGTAYQSAVARLWKPLVDSHGAAPRFTESFPRGYYAASLPLHDVRAVALDDVYWSVLYGGCGKIAGDPARAELDWLSRTLAHAAKGTRNILIMHVPPGIDANGTLITRRLMVIPFLRSGDENDFSAILREQQRSIAFALAGHEHRADFRLVDGVPFLIVSSISPIYDNNPSFLRLQVEADGTLRDYVAYAYDFHGRKWSPEFDFDRAYRARGFTAAALKEAHAQIERDPKVRAVWESAYMSGSPNAVIDESNWRTPWCAQTESGRAFSGCAHLRRRLLVLPVAAGLLLVIVVAAIVLIVTRLGGRRRV
jgi:sphingomyelin phosphodiesterase acid-like 3